MKKEKKEEKGEAEEEEEEKEKGEKMAAAMMRLNPAAVAVRRVEGKASSAAAAVAISYWVL